MWLVDFGKIWGICTRMYYEVFYQGKESSFILAKFINTSTLNRNSGFDVLAQ